MKLPAEPEERKKLIFAVVLGAAAFLYAVHVAVIQPISSSAKRTRADIEANTEAMKTVREYLKETTQRRRAQREEIERIIPDMIAPTFVIEPRLGNYELPVREIIQRWAATADIPKPEVRAGGSIKSRTPLFAPETRRILAAYPTTISFGSDLEGTLRFLQILQNENPYCQLSRISISANPENPEIHSTTIQVDWPVWSDIDSLDRMREAVTNALSGAMGEMKR